jgi:hypothetical protein
VVAVARIAIRLQAVVERRIIPSEEKPTSVQKRANGRISVTVRHQKHDPKHARTRNKRDDELDRGCSGAKTARASLCVCVCVAVCVTRGRIHARLVHRQQTPDVFTPSDHRNRTWANTSKTQQRHRIVEEDVGADCAQEVGGPPFPFGVVCGVCSASALTLAERKKKNSDPMRSHSIQPG